MTTNGTYKSGIYADLLREWGYDAIVPDPIFQDSVIHRMIYDPVFGIKSNSGRLTKEGRIMAGRALSYFEEKGAEAVVLGCTDLSAVILQNCTGKMLLIDSTEALAAALVREATKKRPGHDDHKVEIYDPKRDSC
jgi:aspartate racemase